MKLTTTKLTVGILLTISSCLALTACGQKSKDNANPNLTLPVVQTVVAKTGTLVQSLPVTGTLITLPNQEATLIPQVTGTLQALSVQFGQTVYKGQLIARISSPQTAQQIVQAQATLGQDKVQVQQAQANYLQQQAQTRSTILQALATYKGAQAALSADNATLEGDLAALENSRRNLTREQTLLKEGLVAEKDYETAQFDVSTAQSAVEVQKKQIEGQQQTIDALLQAVEAAKTGTLQNLVKRKDIQVAQQQVTNAEAALAAVKAQAGLYTILSPLTGKVTFIGATQGESVDMTTKLVTVANLTRLQLRVGIPSADSSLIHTGQQIEFTSDLIPNKTFTTNITTISPQVDATTGTVLVFADVNNKSGALKDDMTVAATLIVSRHGNVILLPQSAVLSDSTSGAKTVAVVGPDSVLHITPVTTGLVVNGVVEIDSGLSQGEKVAAAGQYGLTDGTKVKASGLNSEQNGTNGS